MVNGGYDYVIIIKPWSLLLVPFCYVNPLGNKFLSFHLVCQSLVAVFSSYWTHIPEATSLGAPSFVAVGLSPHLPPGPADSPAPVHCWLKGLVVSRHCFSLAD